MNKRVILKPYERVISLNELTDLCGHFTCDTDVNNGYGCKTKKNEGRGVYNSDTKIAPCYSFHCPLAAEITLDNPEDIEIMKQYAIDCGYDMKIQTPVDIYGVETDYMFVFSRRILDIFREQKRKNN